MNNLELVNRKFRNSVNILIDKNENDNIFLEILDKDELPKKVAFLIKYISVIMMKNEYCEIVLDETNENGNYRYVIKNIKYNELYPIHFNKHILNFSFNNDITKCSVCFK